MNSNNYKYKKLENRMNKRAQVAIFVIIALAIVAIFVLIIFLRDGGITNNTSEGLSPQRYLSDCISPSLRENMEIILKQGGYSNVEGFLEYNGDKYKYLCYTNENYIPCIVQQPLLKEQFEKELNSLLRAKSGECVNSLKEEYESRGYDVNMNGINTEFLIVPEGIKYSVNGELSAKKGDETSVFNGFDVEIESQVYDLILTGISIIDFESTYGDSETTLYMQYYPDLKIEKIRLSEGSKIYRVTNVITNETLSFATRSLVFPPGYGLE